MADAWYGPTVNDRTLTFGPLALIAPLLVRLDIAPIIDRHLPPDPQLAFSHGRVLSLLLAARLGNVTIANAVGNAQAQSSAMTQNACAKRALDVSSRILMEHSYRMIRRMRYGTGSSRERHND